MIRDDKTWLTITFTSDLRTSMSRLINSRFEKQKNINGYLMKSLQTCYTLDLSIGLQLGKETVMCMQLLMLYVIS